MGAMFTGANGTGFLPAFGFRIVLETELLFENNLYFGLEFSQILGVTRLYLLDAGLGAGFIGVTGITAKLGQSFVINKNDIDLSSVRAYGFLGFRIFEPLPHCATSRYVSVGALAGLLA